MTEEKKPKYKVLVVLGIGFFVLIMGLFTSVTAMILSYGLGIATTLIMLDYDIKKNG